MADPSGGSGEPLNFFLLRSTVNISYIFAEIYADSIPRPEFALFFVGAAAGNWAGQVGGSAESPTGQLIATGVAESRDPGAAEPQAGQPVDTCIRTSNRSADGHKSSRITNRSSFCHGGSRITNRSAYSHRSSRITNRSAYNHRSRDGQRYSKMYRLKRYRYTIFEKKIE
jgi:hypothetical protein